MKKNEWIWWIIGAGALLWFVNQPSVSAILNPLPYGETDPTLPKGPTVYANPISSVQAGGGQYGYTATQLNQAVLVGGV